MRRLDGETGGRRVGVWSREREITGGSCGCSTLLVLQQLLFRSLPASAARQPAPEVQGAALQVVLHAAGGANHHIHAPPQNALLQMAGWGSPGSVAAEWSRCCVHALKMEACSPAAPKAANPAQR